MIRIPHVHWYVLLRAEVYDDGTLIEVKKCRCGKYKTYVDHTHGTSGW